MLEYMKQNGLTRLALVGVNSQGKSYNINQMIKSIAKKTIFVTNEVKADENLKNSTDTSTLIVWLNSLLDNSNAKMAIQNEIDKVDLDDINSDSFLNISLKNNMNTYKGIISAEIETESNQWKKPGSGERFLGQLLLISKILENNINSTSTYEYLVIDEPEQHLHPSLFIKVSKILNKLSKQGIKVIIATHSPIITQYFIEDTNEIVQVINGECNYLPKLDELMDKSKKFNCYEKEELKFKDYINVEDKFNLYYKNFVLPIIIKSLFCKYMLLGEGAIERKIFDLYILKYGSSMEQNNVDYAIVDGKIFFPIVLKSLELTSHVMTVSMFDLDDEGNPKHNLLNQTIISLSSECISFKPNIEKRIKMDEKIKKDKIDKYRGEVILVNELFLKNDENLSELLEEINNKIIKISTKSTN